MHENTFFQRCVAFGEDFRVPRFFLTQLLQQIIWSFITWIHYKFNIKYEKKRTIIIDD